MKNDPLDSLTDDHIVKSLHRLADDERGNLVAILRHLQQMDRRRIAEELAFPSLFEYCVKELRWAEGETAKRIQVSRTAKRFPLLLGSIRRKLLTLSAAALLAPHLTRKNYSDTVRRAYGRRIRDVERIVATLAPRPEPRERARFLGIAALPAAAIGTPGAVGPEQVVEAILPMPETPEAQRVVFTFTGDERFYARVERAKDLLRAKHADPDFETVFDEAVGALLEKIDPDLKADPLRPPYVPLPGAPRSRIPPSWVKRAVWRRDSGYCSFRGVDGNRCESKAGLQYDHIVPWALGGRSDDPANIRLLCRTHNRLEARRSFGDRLMDEKVPARAASEGEEGPAPGESVGAAGA